METLSNKVKTNFYRLTPFARELRNDSTKSEIRLWCESLRAGQMMGKKFLRQRPIGDYIVDFVCRELKIIIELDGYSHDFKYKRDIKRDKYFTDLGYTVLRFEDEEVMKHIENIDAVIEQTIEEKLNNK